MKKKILKILMQRKSPDEIADELMLLFYQEYMVMLPDAVNKVIDAAVKLLKKKEGHAIHRQA